MDIFRNDRHEIRNVVFIVVDMLKYCYLKKSGNSVDLCPEINFLADNGIVCSNARSNSFPTQFSYPSIFTSTLPLSYGGYDNGIIPRPLTIAESLKDLGFHTIGYSTATWLGRYYGYNRGFKEFYELFDVNNVWGNYADIYYEYYYSLFDKKIISGDEFVKIAGDLFESNFQELLRLFDQTEKQRTVFEYDISLHRHNLALYRKILNQMHMQFLEDRKKFIIEFLRNRLELNLKIFLTGKQEDLDIKDIKTIFPRLARTILRNFGVRFRAYKQAVPATYLRKLINGKISDNRNTKFFIWSHFMDVHDHLSVPNAFGFPPNLIKFNLLRAFKKVKSIGEKELFALSYTDKEINKVIDELKNNNLLESTLIVVCGDHGVGHQAYETKAGNLFDEGTRVPIIFYNPNLKPLTISAPCSLMDIGPTILSIINTPGRTEFEGKSLISDLEPQEPVLLESLGPGPGDFRYKAIKIAVIRKNFKLIWREKGYENSCPTGTNYLFNLDDDPDERKNLYNDNNYKFVVSELEEIALERCRRIRSGLNT